MNSQQKPAHTGPMLHIASRELTGHALNWAVATTLSIPVTVHKGRALTTVPNITNPVLEVEFGYKPFNPTGNWAVGGPLKTGHRISTVQKHDGWWVACIYDMNDDPQFMEISHDELEAAMRCLVHSHFGRTVLVPAELLGRPLTTAAAGERRGVST